MRPTNLEAFWENYREEILKSKSESEVLACRMAFYAGAAAFNGLLINVSTDEHYQELLDDLADGAARIHEEWQ